jgi:hypothetical protein
MTYLCVERVALKVDMFTVSKRRVKAKSLDELVPRGTVAREFGVSTMTIRAVGVGQTARLRRAGFNQWKELPSPRRNRGCDSWPRLSKWGGRVTHARYKEPGEGALAGVELLSFAGRWGRFEP